MNRIAAAAAISSTILAACGNDIPPINTPAMAPVPPAPPSAAAAPRISPQAQLAADMELSGKVKEVLQAPERSHVEVAASDGVVTLYGTVDAPADKDRIAQLAMNVEGVRSVVNNLVAVRGS